MKRGDSAQLTVGCLTVGCKRGVMAGGAFSLVSFLPDVAGNARVSWWGARKVWRWARGWGVREVYLTFLA